MLLRPARAGRPQNTSARPQARDPSRVSRVGARRPGQARLQRLSRTLQRSKRRDALYEWTPVLVPAREHGRDFRRGVALRELGGVGRRREAVAGALRAVIFLDRRRRRGGAADLGFVATGGGRPAGRQYGTV